MKKYGLWLLLVTVFLMGQVTVFGQDEVDCSQAGFATFIADGTADILADDPDAESNFNLAYLYRVGDLTTEFALQCGYFPTTEEVTTTVERTLELAPLSFIIAQSSIGTNVEVALAELENVSGDSFNGQLLYNGLEMGLDGAELGCAGCHNGGLAGPATEGTWTRIDEVRLNLPEFADYSVQQYLVESILHPEAYIVPEYANVQMPANYGTRLDAQQLADLVAYLESQDQLLDDTDSADVPAEDAASVCDGTSSEGCDAVLADLVGDSLRGEDLYNGQAESELAVILGCAGCHTGGVIGPTTDGTWTRIQEERLTLPQFEGYSAKRFLAEAIYIPNSHIPENYGANIMPQNYAEQMSDQDLADVIAFLRETN